MSYEYLYLYIVWLLRAQVFPDATQNNEFKNKITCLQQSNKLLTFLECIRRTDLQTSMGQTGLL